MEQKKSIFNTLYDIDTRSRSAEKDTGKTKLTYLPWATTYSEVCKLYDDVEYVFRTSTRHIKKTKTKVIDENTTTVEEEEFEIEVPYFETEAGLYVQTSVTINGQTKTMMLPVYDSTFRAMRLEPYTYNTKNGVRTVPAATTADIYNSIMRCFAKNLSMFGLGLNYWTGEDAPEAVLRVEKLYQEIDACYLNKKKKEFTDDELIGSYKSLLPEDCNGNYRLCDDEEILKEIKKKLLGLRK